jgi:trk system potassium uptake protein TrkH
MALCSNAAALPPQGHLVEFLAAAGSTLCLLLAAVVPTALSRAALVLGLGGAAFVFRAPLLESPLLTLLSAVLGTAVLYGAFSAPAPQRARRETAFGAALGSLVFWLGLVMLGTPRGPTVALLGASMAIALIASIRCVSRPTTRVRRLLLTLTWTACGVVVPMAAMGFVPVDSIGLATLALVALGSQAGSPGEDRPWAVVLDHPERMLVLTFLGLCVLGTLLLSLPNASVEPIGLLEAAFTSVSAVCVTGLAVFDVGTRLTGFGQCALLFLIQVGGLGIMTLSTLVYTWVGRRMSLRHELAVQALLGPEGRGALGAATKRIVAFTAVAEALGAVVLTSAFLARGESFGSAFFRGVFTSVSAFCNAGFALQADSLVGYAESPIVLHTVAALIVLGGLSPAAVLALPGAFRTRGRPLRLQYLVPLSVTAALLAVGTLVMLAFEWERTLSTLPWHHRFHNAWFQSVTLRTAGFNSVDVSQWTSATLTVAIAMMFVGGSPGGTAGGIKTTTFALMLFGVVRAVRGQDSIVLFKRRVSEPSVRRASVTFTLALVFALSATVALQLTQDMPPEMAAFEVVSALGTVGLTIGGTAQLDGVGQVIIMGCMFLGRVGGLSLLMFLSTRQSMRRLSRPEEDVEAG